MTPHTVHERTGGDARVMRQVLLGCGIAYGVVYIVTNDVVAVMLYDGYSRMDQLSVSFRLRQPLRGPSCGRCFPWAPC